MVFLFSVSIMPFSTMLLAQFTAYRIALLTYWLNIVLAGGSLYFSWNCAKQLGLVKEDIAPDVFSAIQRRILFAQALYAFGALLCVFSTHWSIAFIVVVQLNYAIAPKVWRRSTIP